MKIGDKIKTYDNKDGIIVSIQKNKKLFVPKKYLSGFELQAYEKTIKKYGGVFYKGFDCSVEHAVYEDVFDPFDNKQPKYTYTRLYKLNEIYIKEI